MTSRFLFFNCSLFSFKSSTYLHHRTNGKVQFLSFRLHGAIYAFMAHVPFLLAEVHEKASNFLKDIDWPEKFRVGDFEVSPDSLVSIVEKMLEGHDFSQSIKRCENDAEKNFTHAVFD